MKINYQTIIDLGFEREDINDSNFYDQYGFQYFVVTKKLDKRLHLDWDCNTGTVTMIRLNKEHFIIGKMQMETLEDVKHIIEFFKNN